MDDDNIQTNNLADLTVAIALQIPQGTSLQLQVNQTHYSFYLNQQVVEQIQQAKNTGIPLDIPPKVLIPLWYYTCFSHNVVPTDEAEITSKVVTKSYIIFLVNILKAFGNKSLQKNTTLQPGFTFTSYYQLEQLPSVNDYKQDRVLQSVVLFHGDILHKIKWDFIQNNLDCQKIIAAHYWLTEQILSALRSKLNLLVWEISSLVTSGFLTWNISKLDLLYLGSNIIFLIILWLVITVVFISVRYVFVKQLQKNTTIKYQYLNWLSWGITCIIPILSLTIFSMSKGMIHTSTVLLPFIPPLIPLVAKRSLNFILPLLGKLMIRRLLSV
ncbi:hypothetical protein [Anabaena subtropica]|uniref:Uncharacterized protein n=1 Tax=Anabaena subtropica FACHB-260 TaxID=2692884 RepID=A0ABR8CIB3_9NOST|nr:hypothetical protein [Anabaena subtropica]MBD2342936.1 hypothetical protein [Anabaena subtropica FACHB-260]